MKKNKHCVVDINCDLGEGLDNDALIMPYITSCNIACGGHAGDSYSMKKTVELALQHNLNIGAHPSYPDIENFGRKPMDIELPQLKDALLEQINALQVVAKEQGAELSHIKPHGALYNRAAVDAEYMTLLLDVMTELKEDNENLVLFGLACSPCADFFLQKDIQFFHEAFVDRHYLDNGQLVPRSHVNAVIDDVDFIARRALAMVQQQEVESLDGNVVPLQCDTLCIHGDHPEAVPIAQAVYQSLTDNGEHNGEPHLC